jgi:hypothetical protein
MRIRAAFGLLCIFSLLFCFYPAPSANAASLEDEVIKVENNWVKAFNNMDSGLMSALYWHSTKTQVYSPNVLSKEWSPNASSAFPTILAKGWDSIKAIFKEYCKQPKGVYKWSLRDPQTTMLTNDVAQVIGYHDLVKKKADGSDQSAVSIRFTHVIRKIDRKWVIVHSHEAIQQAARQPMSPAGGDNAGASMAGPPGAAAPAGVAGAGPSGAPMPAGAAGAGSNEKK